MRRARWIIVPLVGLGVALGACGDDEDEERAGTSATGTATEEATAPGGPVVAKVRISETEYRLDPANPRVSKAGVVEFAAVNDGKIAHALEVEGPEGEVETGDLEPGQSADFAVDLAEPGSYVIYCPIANHRELGMDGKVTVGGGGSAAPGDDDEREQETEKEDDDSGGAGGGYSY
jgi:uncharacterized cupredoxin-like copper-binding protein